MSSKDRGQRSPGWRAALRWVVPGIALVAVSVALATLEPVRDAQARFVEWVKDRGPLAPVLIAAAYVPACLLLLPGSVLTLGAGWALGVPLGIPAVSIGSTLGATAAFLAGRTLARRRIEKAIADDPRFHALDEAIATKGWKIVLLLRLSPIFPFNVMNYVLGATRVSFKHYVLATWLGMLPGTVFYVALGSALGSLGAVEGGERNPARIAFFVVGLLVSLAVTVVLARKARRIMRDAAPALASP